MLNRTKLFMQRKLKSKSSTEISNYTIEYNELYSKIHEICTDAKVTASPEKKRRKFIIYQLLKSMVMSRNIHRTAEFGVFRGQTSLLISHICNAEHDIFDSFKGLSDATKEDGELNKETFGMMSPQSQHISRILPKANLYEGWIPEDLPSEHNYTYDFVHIDLDLYTPVLGALNWCINRMAPGAIIVVDDYHERWPGAMQAVNEFMEKYGDRCIGFDTTLRNFVIIIK